METKRWNVTINESMDKDAIEEAAALLRSGETVAFPTETVYGLGADATNENAVAKIFTAKGRPQDNPLIAHVATKEQLKRLVDSIPPYAEKLMDHFFTRSNNIYFTNKWNMCGKCHGRFIHSRSSNSGSPCC